MTVITPISFGAARRAAPNEKPIFFTRYELQQILDIYGRMVAAGRWRDYSIEVTRQAIVFSAYRRASEMPDYRIIKEPALARRQGAYRVVNATGHILRRGAAIETVLKPLAGKLFKTRKI